MKIVISFFCLTGLFSFYCDQELDENFFDEEGIASYYSDYYEGRITANGEIFKQQKLTAAHKELPFGTIVQVLNLINNKSVQVTINDRGPFIEGRIIDLSYLAAEKIDMINVGIAEVRITVTSP